VYDPVGFALAEQTLDAFFPPLEYVVSKSSGSLINAKYGPKVYVSKYETSVAFLATESLSDKNSLAARMLQARFTNYGRFSCMAMLEWSSDQSNAAAGTNAPEAAQRDNPDGYNSPYDRNWLLCAPCSASTARPLVYSRTLAHFRAQILCDHLHGEPEQGDRGQRAGGQRAFVVESTRHPPRALRARRGLTARGAARRNNARSPRPIARPCRPACGAPTLSDWARATHSGTW
jgi:hypothetical protein